MGFELYESFSAWTYFWVCGGLAAPLWLQPVVAPGLTKDADRPLAERYALKANVWLGVFGFAGNYWYTHYFYSVLGAERFRRADSFSDESRRRRGRDVESPWRRVAATPRLGRGDSLETSRGDAAATTWKFCGDESRRRRGRDADSP